MNLKLLKNIKCINCNRKDLEVVFFDNSGIRVMEVPAHITGFLRDGILLCRCGYFYPIIGGIIRTIKTDSAHYAEYLIKFRDILHKLKVEHGPPRPSVKVMHAHNSFGYEWSMIKSNHTVWGQSREDMFNNLEKQLLLPKEQMRDMLILDAGCGHGRVTSAFAKLSSNVISLEISEGRVLMWRTKSVKNRIMYCLFRGML